MQVALVVCFLIFLYNAEESKLLVTSISLKYWYHFFTAIKCLSLNEIENGVILYANDTTPQYELGTVATYSCNTGFGLDLSNGSETRTCVDDGDNNAEGIFDLMPPSCVRKYNY